MTLKIVLRLDISKERKSQTLDKTKNRYDARRTEDDIFDKFKKVRDGLKLVKCPEHQTTAKSTSFKESAYINIGAGESRETIIDFSLNGCCCEKLADAAIQEFKYQRLTKL